MESPEVNPPAPKYKSKSWFKFNSRYSPRANLKKVPTEINFLMVDIPHQEILFQEVDTVIEMLKLKKKNKANNTIRTAKKSPNKKMSRNANIILENHQPQTLTISEVEMYNLKMKFLSYIPCNNTVKQ